MTVRMGTEADKRIIFSVRPQAEQFFSADGYFLSAEESGEIVGFAAVVFENCQRKGFATMLVQEILNIEKKSGTYQVRAYCDIGNAASHGLWRKNRFGISPVKMLNGSISGSFVTYVL